MKGIEQYHVRSLCVPLKVHCVFTYFCNPGNNPVPLFIRVYGRLSPEKVSCLENVLHNSTTLKQHHEKPLRYLLPVLANEQNMF